MAIAIVIPARHASTRFPGKPLTLLGGKPMVVHVAERARAAITDRPDIRVAVATDHDDIRAVCAQHGIETLMTPADCATGSDRVIEAADQMGLNAEDVVINLQGDAPLTPVSAIAALIDEFTVHPDTRVATLVKRLRWSELDALREAKRSTPFSGTTVTLSKKMQALWFSKQIIPAMRNEAALRAASGISPVFQHIGLYGYGIRTLERFTNWPEGTYETLEGLEQLRFLENGTAIQCLELDPDTFIHSGIDSPEDLARAEAALKQHPAS